MTSQAERFSNTSFDDNQFFAGLRVSAHWVVFTVLAIAYGSLIPFTLDLAAFRIGNGFGLSRLCFAKPGLEDLVTNLVLYAPLGIVLFLNTRHRTLGILGRLFVAGFIGFGVSLLLESMQTGIRGRVGSWVDVALNSISCIGGFIGAAVAFPFFEALAKFFGGRALTRPYRLLWLGSAAGVLVIALAPFDFVTSTGALHDSLRTSLVSFSSISGAIQSEGLAEFFIGSLRSVFTFTLIGYLGALAAGERNDEKVRLEPVAIGAVGLVVLIEVLQLFTGSHVFDLVDVVAGSIGSMAGVAIGTMVLLRRPECVVRWNPRRAFPTRIIVAAVVCQGVLLFVPTFARLTEFTLDSVSLVHCTLPFEALWRRPMSIASQEILSQFIRFGSLGLGIAIVLRRSRLPHAWLLSTMTVVIAALTIAGLKIAVVQGRLDITNTLLALFAAIFVSKTYPFMRSHFFRLAGETHSV